MRANPIESNRKKMKTEKNNKTKVRKERIKNKKTSI